MAVNCERVIGDLFAAWTQLDLDEVMSHFAEHAVWTTSPCPQLKASRRSVK